MQISKELLSEVLGHTDICNERIIHDKLLYMCKNDGMMDYEYEYNIYELANKCKLWAFEKGYTIIDYIDLDNDEFWTCRAYPNGLNDGFDWEEIYQPTSPISIFRTCQWILDNVKTNSLS